MPSPPKPKEKKSDFLSRCIKAYKAEGMKAKDARDKCYAIWSDQKESK